MLVVLRINSTIQSIRTTGTDQLELIILESPSILPISVFEMLVSIYMGREVSYFWILK
jgi:hypothetical protein